MISISRAAGLFLLLLTVLGGCQSLPSANDRVIPKPVVVADGSAQRATLNAEVYDAATALVARRFYQDDFGGQDWPAEVARRRDTVVAQPDEPSFYRALNEALGLLGDAHTRATSPTMNQRRQQARLAETVQFGMRLWKAEGLWIVTFVRAGGAASDAGIQPGWYIDTVDGEPFDISDSYDGERRWRFIDAVDQPHETVMSARATARQAPLVTRRPDEVLLIQFDAFDRGNRQAILDRLEVELIHPPRAVIVDLRGNIGGQSDEIGPLLAPFFAEPRLFARVKFGWLPERRLRTRPGRSSFGGPLAVLTSEDSASAAEIYAAAVQEARRGIVVGRTTAGAVVGARHYALPDGGRLSVGVVSIQTADGHVLEKAGVTPDLEVAPSAADIRSGHDPVLEAAVRALLQP